MPGSIFDVAGVRDPRKPANKPKSVFEAAGMADAAHAESAPAYDGYGPPVELAPSPEQQIGELFALRTRAIEIARRAGHGNPEGAVDAALSEGPVGVGRVREVVNRAGPLQDQAYEARRGEATFRRMFAAPLKGLTGGLIDTAKMGEEYDATQPALLGQTAVERSRQDAGMLERLAEGGLDMAGAVMPISRLTNLARAGGLGRAAVPGALAIYSGTRGAAEAPAGHKLEAFGQGALAGAAMGAVAGPVARILGGNAPGWIRGASADGFGFGAGGVAGQIVTGQDVHMRPEDVILGTAFHIVQLPARRQAEAMERIKIAAKDARNAEDARVARELAAAIAAEQAKADAAKRADYGMGTTIGGKPVRGERGGSGTKAPKDPYGLVPEPEPTVVEPLASMPEASRPGSMPGGAESGGRGTKAPKDPYGIVQEATPTELLASMPEGGKPGSMPSGAESGGRGTKTPRDPYGLTPESAPQELLASTPDQAAGPRAKRGSGETGMARLPSVQELKDAGKAVLSPLKTLGRAAYEVWDRVGVDPFLRSLVDRVTARSGAGKGLADQVQRGLDMAREGYIRPMEPLYEQAASATNLSRVAGLQKPTFNPGENYGPSLLQEAIEGRMPGRGAPEQAGIDSLITYKDAKLLIEHKAGYMRDGPNGPEPIPQASKNAPQMVTAEGLDMIRGGNIPEVLLDGTIKETKRIQGVDVTKAEVTEHFLDLARTLEREGPQAAELRMASEMGRKYNFPGWLRVNGAEVPFLEVNGRRYLDRLHRAAPARYAVAMALGQGPDASGTAAVESFLGRDASAARDLLRAAGGGSLTEPLIRTNSPIAPLARGAGAVYSMFKSGALSLSGIKNMNEVFSGPGFVTGRYGRTLNAIWDTLSDYGGTVEGLVKQGLKTRERPDMTVDSRHLLSEYTKLGARLLREGGSGWAESIQETVVGRKAHLERAGIDTAVAMGQRLSGSDVALLRQYSDLTKPEMEALAKGGTLDVRRMAELTDQMTRRLVTEAQGSNVNPAQLSKFQHTHIGKSLAAFQHFVAMMTRQTYKGVKVGAEQIAMGIKNRDVHSVGSGVLTATRVPLGVTAGTIASALIGSFIVGGPEGIDGEWRRFRTDPIRYATRALVAGYTSGGLGGLTMALSEDNDLEDVIFAFRAFKEVGGMVGMNVDGGEKPYAGKSFLDRIGTLFERNVPVTKAFTTGAMAAIWQDDRSRSELMAARKSYWDFRERNGLTKGQGRDWEDTPWNVTMQKVYRSIMAKEPDSKWVDALFEGLDTGAFEGKEHQKDSVQASLRARLMLEGEGMNRQTLQALLADIGEDAYRALYTHDQMLKRVIDKLR